MNTLTGIISNLPNDPDNFLRLFLDATLGMGDLIIDVEEIKRPFSRIEYTSVIQSFDCPRVFVDLLERLEESGMQCVYQEEQLDTTLVIDYIIDKGDVLLLFSLNLQT
jgi:hypothetical protein